MEQSTYTEANAKKKNGAGTVVLKTLLILIILMIFAASLLSRITLIMFVGVGAIFLLIWYWPRFNVEWEYVYCDGQLDFDMIQGGEKRKNILRIEIEDADVVAPLDSDRLAGYQHLEVKDYSSTREDADMYGIAIRLPEKENKVLIKFEPSEKMVDMMHSKCPNIVEVRRKDE